jgi:signal transduction histidine kinase
MKNEEIYIVTNGQRCLFNVFEIATYLGGTLGFAIDMSAKDKIKHELERYICAQSDLLESSASAMAIFTSDMRIQSYNQAFIKLWGLDESWLNSKPTYGQILEELRERRKLPEQVNFSEFKKNHLKFFTELLTPHNEFFYLPDGTALRVLVIAHALGGLLFAYEDMTDHLALERSYNILIAVQKATIDALQESIAVYGSDGKLKICNPGYIKVCGLEESFFAQQPHINEVVNFGKEFYLEDHWQQAKLDLVRTINERKSCETIMERKNGTILKRRSMPLPDGAFLVTYLDITDSVMLERSLLQHNQVLLDADTSKTEFLANISYELRSPLTSVLGFSELLMKECFGNLNEKQQEYVLAIYQSSQYVMTLVNDILDIASLEAGYNDLELLYFDVYQAILAVIATINERIKSEKLHFTLNCSPFFGKMLGDERRFKQVVLKLLSNAIKFNKPEGYINLTMSEGEDHKIILIVEDNGIGISYDEQKMVFDKFYRNELHKTGKSGVGLGLSIVKSFVELHNGSIVIDAERKIGTKISCIFDRINPLLLVKLNQNHPGELIA